MRFLIAAIFILFTSLGFSQENLQHKVVKGETLYSISKKYNVPVSQLEQLNPQAKKSLSLHSILIISENNNTQNSNVFEHKVIAKETLFGLSKRYNVSIEKLKELNPSIESEGLKVGTVIKIADSTSQTISDQKADKKSKRKKKKKEEESKLEEVFHIVSAKETKYGISKKYKISIADLEKLNPQIKSGLEIGTRLVIQTSQKITQEEITPNIIIPVSIDGMSKADSVIATASNNIGTKYRSGGTDSEGFDCSGLMFSSFKTIDITLPRTSSEQANFGVKIDKYSAQKGDLIFFATNGSSVSHVGLITEVSENDIKFVHSSTSSGVIISSLSEEYYEKRFVQINRVIP